MSYPYAFRRRRAEDLEAAGHQCARCHAVEVRWRSDRREYSNLERAHLDGDRQNGLPENIAVLCRRCHRRHDYQAWALQCRITRSARKDAARPLLQEAVSTAAAAESALRHPRTTGA